MISLRAFKKKMFDKPVWLDGPAVARTRLQWKKSNVIAMPSSFLPLGFTYRPTPIIWRRRVGCVLPRAQYVARAEAEWRGNVGSRVIGFWGGRERQRNGWDCRCLILSRVVPKCVFHSEMVVVRVGSVHSARLCRYLASAVVWATNAQSSASSLLAL